MTRAVAAVAAASYGERSCVPVVAAPTDSTLPAGPVGPGMQYGGATRPLEENSPFAERLGPLRLEILRYVHRLTGDADAAEDVTQEALVRLITSEVDEMRNPRAWLYRVATNLVRDRARTKARHRRLSVPIDTDAPTRPDQELDRRETVDRVRTVLDRLSPRDREMLILRQSGFRYKEIAEVAGVQPQSMPVLAARAMERFRAAWLAEVGDESSG